VSTAAPEHGEKIIDPIHQFVINRLVPIEIGGVDISFTNSALWAVIAVVCASLLFILAPRNDPNRLQSVAESIYELVHGFTHEVPHENARTYFPSC
jgi:F-type H+-transporting ATPase subunit a